MLGWVPNLVGRAKTSLSLSLGGGDSLGDDPLWSLTDAYGSDTWVLVQLYETANQQGVNAGVVGARESEVLTERVASTLNMYRASSRHRPKDNSPMDVEGRGSCQRSIDGHKYDWMTN